MDGSNVNISRRDALKKIGIGIAGAAVTTCLTKIGLDLKTGYDSNTEEWEKYAKDMEVNGRIVRTDGLPFPANFEFVGKTKKLEGETARIVNIIEQRHGIKIISPLEWENNENLPWSMDEISIVTETVSRFPPKFIKHSRAPLEIILIKSRGGAGFGGAYYARNVMLDIPNDFSPDKKPQNYLEKLYENQRQHLIALAYHEFTHSFTEAFPQIAKQWIKEMGWKIDASGKWINIEPQDLIHDAGGDTSPNEDIAVSCSLMKVNPQALSEKRKAFISKYLP